MVPCRLHPVSFRANSSQLMVAVAVSLLSSVPSAALQSPCDHEFVCLEHYRGGGSAPKAIGSVTCLMCLLQCHSDDRWCCGSQAV